MKYRWRALGILCAFIVLTLIGVRALASESPAVVPTPEQLRPEGRVQAAVERCETQIDWYNRHKAVRPHLVLPHPDRGRGFCGYRASRYCHGPRTQMAPGSLASAGGNLDRSRRELQLPRELGKVWYGRGNVKERAREISDANYRSVQDRP